jgi:hypothetical protein
MLLLLSYGCWIDFVVVVVVLLLDWLCCCCGRIVVGLTLLLWSYCCWIYFVVVVVVWLLDWLCCCCGRMNTWYVWGIVIYTDCSLALFNSPVWTFLVRTNSNIWNGGLNLFCCWMNEQ